MNIKVLLLAAVSILNCAPVFANDLGVGRAVQIVEQSLTILSAETLDAGGLVVGGETVNFTSANISLSTTLKVSAGSEISVNVIELGSEVSNAETQKVNISLVPPQEGEVIAEAGDDTAKQLAAVLLQTTNELSQALSNSQRLESGSLSVTIKFAFNRKANGGIGFKLFGIGFGGSATVSDSEIQEITLNFE